MYASADHYLDISIPIKTFTVDQIMRDLSRVMRKPTICICENKDAEADQRLCSRYLYTTMTLLPKSKISLQWLHSLVCVRPGQNPHCCFSHVAANYKRFLYVIAISFP